VHWARKGLTPNTIHFNSVQYCSVKGNCCLCHHIRCHHSTLKMGSTGSSKTLVPIYQTTWHHITTVHLRSIGSSKTLVPIYRITWHHITVVHHILLLAFFPFIEGNIQAYEFRNCVCVCVCVFASTCT
jgi:hypothetical protein